jgi:hypothetical protein
MSCQLNRSFYGQAQRRQQHSPRPGLVFLPGFSKACRIRLVDVQHQESDVKQPVTWGMQCRFRGIRVSEKGGLDDRQTASIY